MVEKFGIGTHPYFQVPEPDFATKILDSERLSERSVNDLTLTEMSEGILGLVLVVHGVCVEQPRSLICRSIGCA